MPVTLRHLRQRQHRRSELSLYRPLSRPVIFIYDGYEDGIGFTRRAMEVLPDWQGAMRHLLQECPCEDGCPSCVQDPQCGSANGPLDKPGAIFLLEELWKLE
ncbi:MAG: DUF1998 domain-containing protein [Deltaproteobacteria bacterium]|nr:DUF1998 domain-containing protein [Deltaproteobacteria bacterium]